MLVGMILGSVRIIHEIVSATYKFPEKIAKVDCRGHVGSLRDSLNFQSRPGGGSGGGFAHCCGTCLGVVDTTGELIRLGAV
jgi:hypothetical protein